MLDDINSEDGSEAPTLVSDGENGEEVEEDASEYEDAEEEIELSGMRSLGKSYTTDAEAEEEEPADAEEKEEDDEDDEASETEEAVLPGAEDDEPATKKVKLGLSTEKVRFTESG